YGELGGEANRWARALRSRGLSHGDVAAIAAPNSFDYLVVVAGAMQVGVRLVPVNFHLTSTEIAYIVADSGTKLLVVDERIASSGREAADLAGLAADQRVALGKIQGFVSHRTLLDGVPDTPPEDRSPGQRLYYTSGTSGKPKGVVRPMPQGDVDELAVRHTRKVFGGTGRDASEDGVTLVPGPLYHAAPMGAALGA